MHVAKIQELRFVFASFVTASLVGIVGVAWGGFRIILSPLIAILILPFVQQVFYKRRDSIYTKLLGIALILEVYVVIARLIWEFSLNNDGPHEFYLSYLVAILVIYMLCFGWFFAECIRIYRKISTSSGIEPWTRTRYLFLAISCILAIVAALIPLISSSHEAYHDQLALVSIVQASLFVSFSLTSIIAWFMPTRFKRYLNNRDKEHVLATKGSAVLISSGDPTVKLDSPMVMSIIDFLGNRLAPRINKNPAAIKGLLLVSIQAAEEHNGKTGIDFVLLHDAIKNEVRFRLGQLGIQGSETVIDELERDVLDIQSLLVLGRF